MRNLPMISVEMCPKADDPITVNQFDRSIGIIVQSHNHSLPLEGSVGITLYGETSFISLSYPSNEDCQYALENSSRIGTVTCNYTVNTVSRREISITFTSWPLYANEIFPNSGNPALSDFECVTYSKTSSACELIDIQSTQIKG